MEFRKYQHLERFGTDEVQGIEFGEVYIFPKIDGTNASVWLGDDRYVKAGSRNRELSYENDNAGFFKFASAHDGIIRYLQDHPNHRLYGEWLVPHSLKTYREDAWRKFYVFDVVLDVGDDDFEYIPYEVYKNELDEYGIDYIIPIAKMKNSTYESFMKSLEKNTFLIKDGEGVGEGIVIKNYGFKNRFRRTTWAKIVTTEFKEKHAKEMGVNEIELKKMIEEEIVDEYVTSALVEKEYAKIVNEMDGWQSKYIPILLSKVFYEVINEETWHFIKKHKMPTINFRTLNALTTQKIKEVKKELF